MKKLFFLTILSFLVFIQFSCDSYPQTVTVKTTYTTPAGIDSTYMIVWQGTDINQNPLFEDGDYELLNLAAPSIKVYKIPNGVNQSFQRVVRANGETFKIAIVPFKMNIAAPLTVSAFYVLPTPPAKATIINVEIF